MQYIFNKQQYSRSAHRLTETEQLKIGKKTRWHFCSLPTVSTVALDSCSWLTALEPNVVFCCCISPHVCLTCSEMLFSSSRLKRVFIWVPVSLNLSPELPLTRCFVIVVAAVVVFHPILSKLKIYSRVWENSRSAVSKNIQAIPTSITVKVTKITFLTHSAVCCEQYLKLLICSCMILNICAYVLTKVFCQSKWNLHSRTVHKDQGLVHWLCWSAVYSLLKWGE